MVSWPPRRRRSSLLERSEAATGDVVVFWLPRCHRRLTNLGKFSGGRMSWSSGRHDAIAALSLSRPLSCLIAGFRHLRGLCDEKDVLKALFAYASQDSGSCAASATRRLTMNYRSGGSSQDSGTCAAAATRVFSLLNCRSNYSQDSGTCAASAALLV